MIELKGKAKLVTFGWMLTVVSLFFYSFTQIDLGLTLTRASWWQVVQKKFQYIGYFDRPLSTIFYLFILLIIYTGYFILLRLVRKGEFSSKQIWILIGLTAAILFLSYNAFSYDLFNYIFDAKIITFYQQNPYQHKALDFPGDPMLGFMHWTHRVYPYGPSWLALTVPLSFLGFRKLLPTMILFRSLAVLSYLASCWSINKILVKTKPKLRSLGLSVFALSPLVVIEGLVSAHNDLVMMALVLMAFWLMLEKKLIPGWILLGLSIGIKFATVFLLPIFLLVSFWQVRKKRIDWEKVWFWSFLLMLAALLAVIRRDEFKPWYLLYLWPFLALMPEKKWLFWPVVGLSIGALLHYAPFLYLGNWNPPVPEIKLWLTVGFLVFGLVVGLLCQARQKSNRL